MRRKLRSANGGERGPTPNTASTWFGVPATGADLGPLRGERGDGGLLLGVRSVHRATLAHPGRNEAANRAQFH
jgi:hypothetical protein